MNEYTITLNEQDMKVLNDMLLEMPYKIAAPLINKINAQIIQTVNNSQTLSE